MTKGRWTVTSGISLSSVPEALLVRREALQEAAVCDRQVSLWGALLGLGARNKKRERYYL